MSDVEIKRADRGPADDGAAAGLTERAVEEVVSRFRDVYGARTSTRSLGLFAEGRGLEVGTWDVHREGGRAPRNGLGRATLADREVPRRGDRYRRQGERRPERARR